MRLKPHEREKTKDIARQFFGSDARVWLFGSRVDDTRRGGDIDLYIETSRYSGLLEAKVKALLALQRALGEQKVDLIAYNRDEELSAIAKIAKQNGIEL